MLTAFALVCCVVFHAPERAPDATHPSTVRVFVYTAESPGEPNSDEEQGRRDAVRELREALRRKSGITLVQERDQADVVVEVTDREQRDIGEGGFGGKKITSLAETIIRVRVTAGDHQAELKGMGPGGGGRAAKDAADRLVKWIGRNVSRQRSIGRAAEPTWQFCPATSLSVRRETVRTSYPLAAA